MRLVIAQKTPPRPGQLPRVLELDGSVGPIDGLAFGVSQRGTVEWLKGSSVAVVQLDGPEEIPTNATFRWFGRDYVPGEAKLDGQPIAEIDTLVDTLASMVRDSVLVDVTWRGRTQVAFLQRFEPEEGLAFEWDATLTFEWVESPLPSRSSPLRTRSPLGLWAQLKADFEDFVQPIDSFITFVETGTTFDRQVVDDVAQGVADVRASISRVENAAISARNVAHDAIGVVHSVAAAIQQVLTSADRIDEACSISADSLAQTDDAYGQIRARSWRTSQLKGARLAKHEAALERANYRPESDVLGIHTGVTGDTIWSVSRLWYGHTRFAEQLSRRNNLISSVIRPGQRVVIPAISEAAA